MIDLNKEAEEYCKKNYPDYLDKKEALLVQEDFIAGANSKHVQAKIIQAQIELISDMYESYRNGEFFNTEELIQNFEEELQQQLKQLENG